MTAVADRQVRRCSRIDRVRSAWPARTPGTCPAACRSHVRDLAEALIDLGHDVSVITPVDDETTLPPYAVDAGRRCRSVQRLGLADPARTGVHRRGYGAGCVTAHFDVVARARADRAECQPAVANMVADGPHRRDLPHGKSALAHADTFASWFQPSFEKLWARIAVSEAARRTIVEHLGADAVLIPNGVAVAVVRRRQRRWRTSRRTVPRSPSSAGSTSRARVWTSCSRRCRRWLRESPRSGCWSPAPATSTRWPSIDRRRYAAACTSSAWSSEEDKRAVVPQRGRLLRAQHRPGELRHRPARSDGGGTPGGRQRHRCLPAGAGRRPSRAALPGRGSGRAGARSWSRC